MKRAVSLLLSAALLLSLLSACRKPADEPDSPAAERSALELVDAVLPHCGFDRVSVDVEYLTAEEGEDFLAAYLENAYGLEVPWEDAAVIRATGASAFELAVLRMTDENAAVRAASSLMSYLYSRQGDFAGYAPAEADMVANGSINQQGVYAALFICPNTAGADAAFLAALNGNFTQGDDAVTDAITDVKGLRDFLVSDRGMDGAALEKLDDGDLDALSAYVEDAYGLTPDQWDECAIAKGTGDSAFEVAVFRFPGGSEGAARERAWMAESALNDYLDAREAQFDSATEQAKLLHRALVVDAEEYMVLLACEDAEGAAGAFSSASGVMGYGWSIRYPYLDTDPDFPDRCAFTPPNEDDMSIYDTTAIRAAWAEGDPSGLSDYDRDIYDRAKQVLDELLKNGMSDYEKEVAIYSWIVQNVNYDWTHQDRMKETPRESFTPYGGLVNHTAICLGYATTFQLLCDLAGVECVTVVGAAHMSSSDHGWNMVRLSGEWYCVDVTWDANMREQIGLGQQEYWNYFNITSDDMANSDHQWDYANVPEATAEDYGRG